ncbi:MAG: serine/threonine protein kinase [Pirellulales bacterium]|nr:serine/threonine protein kinase [Pirellulales bacterium]
MLGRLGPYEVQGVIGWGGMAVVLRAYDRSLNRNVAVKVLSPQLATSGPARQRFAREAQAAAAVVHEHVVPIHAVSEAGGLPYLVMTYVPGRSLQQRIDQAGPLTVAEILRIGMQTAAGLAAAHAQGLVHRDVKPANILLENGVERAMIADFGLARAADDASLTRSGIIAGTPHYMAPEQAEGQPADHRADLFSLGGVMYAMGTGHPPFRAETALAVLRRICQQPPRPIRQINPEIPDWLAAVVEKLLAKDPSDRFQSAAEVAELLGRYLAHFQHPTAVPAPRKVAVRRGAAGRTKKPLWHHRPQLAWLASALAAAVGVSALLYFGPWFSYDEPSAGSPPVAPAPPRASDGQGLSPAAVFELTRGSFDRQQWETDVDQVRRRIAELEATFHQVPEPRSGQVWAEGVSQLQQQLDELRRQLDDHSL